MIALTDTGLSCLLEAAKAIEPKIAGSSFRIGINVGDIIIDDDGIFGGYHRDRATSGIRNFRR
jgi:hypothetical protein